jgi:methyltransferase (TIGR00027 family)
MTEKGNNNMDRSEFRFETLTDCARLVALYRALESERNDALFHDPYARLLAGERGEQLAHGMPYGFSSAWGTIIRTYLFDQMILRLIEQNTIHVVLNLGAGFDTRPYRLPLPDSLHWIEADLAKPMASKKRVMLEAMPKCTLESIVLDLTDDSMLLAAVERMSSSSRVGIVITEGVLLYLSERQVSRLAEILYEQETFVWWLTDVISPTIAETLQKLYGSLFFGEHVRVQFAPTDAIAFFRKHGWEPTEVQSFREEAQHLGRLPVGAFASTFGGPHTHLQQVGHAGVSGGLLLKRSAMDDGSGQSS